jgi:alpha-1,2-mannosyltransferase
MISLDVISAALFIVVVLFGLVTYVAIAYWTNSVGNRLRNPPRDWKEYLEQAQEAGARLLTFGDKDNTIRRQLILASANVSYYTNLLPLSVSKLPKNALAKKFEKGKQVGRKVIFGFFHPYANAGGGGERVLWAAIKQTLANNELNVCAVYVGRQEGVTPSVLLTQAKERFGIELDEERVVFIFLTKRRLVDDSFWPRFTLIGQAIGSVLLAYEAISLLVPDVFVDTMGYAFCYPLISWVLDIPIMAYVHYPFISSDMFKGISFFSFKNAYWRIMMLAYAYVGSYATVVATNSTWTNNHIKSLWWYQQQPDHVKTVYPPCATQDFEIPEKKPRSPVAVCISQFRPEKRHDFLLNEFAKFMKSYKGSAKPHLILIGSVRNDDDKSRVYSLRLLARELELTDDYVTFVLDAPWSNVRAMLQSSSVGVNAMWNEHFGMGIVEYMAAGLIPIAHNSAGARMDIIKDDKGVPGFLFASESDRDFRADEKIDDLATALEKAFNLEEPEIFEYRLRAYEAAQRFSDDVFASAWNTRVEILLKLESMRRRKRMLRNKFD